MSIPACITLGRKSARGASDGDDRLSSLPDALLHQVMSFLPAPEVVRTSLLSSRWRNLWTSTPFIHIDRLGCLNPTEGWTEDDVVENFVDHLLLLRDRDVSLDEARICINRGDRGKSFAWIRHAIKHNARLLHVYGASSHVQLDSIALCPSQYLERIRLESVTFVDGISRPLNYNFPILGYLELDRCIVRTKAEILSKSLKTLHIMHCSFSMDLLICATNLTHLSILHPTMYSAAAIVIKDLSSLVTAVVSLSSFRSHGSGYTIADHCLLDGLSHATTLELRAPLPEIAFERGLQACPTFSNLIMLVLGDWCLASDFYPLFRILHRSPRLKVLSLKLKMEHCQTCKKTETSSLLTRQAPALRGYPCIERIKIYCSTDDPRIGALVQALLPIFIPYGEISIEGY